MRSERSQTNNLSTVSPLPPTQQIADLLAAASVVMVASHIDPDGDALGTSLAMAEHLRDLGKTVYLVRDSAIPEKYSFLPGVENFLLPEMFAGKPAPDTAVILECPTMVRIGAANRLLGRDTTIVNIDHHRDNSEFGRINWIDSTASSVGQMIYEYFEQVGYEVKEDVATNLYAAILTDTGRFRYQATTPRTFHIAAELVRLGADPRDVCDRIYYSMQASTMKLTGKVLNSLEFHLDGKICLLTLSKEMLVSSGANEAESDGLVDFTLFTKGVITGALLKEIDTHRTKVSLRSSNGINVSDLAAKYGGGGHFNAAGCIVPKGLEDAKVEIIQLLTEATHALAK